MASGSLFTKIARGFEEWAQVGLLPSGEPDMNGAQAAGCAPVANAFADGPGDLPARPARHDRQVTGDRRSRRWPVRRWSSRGGRAAAWTPSPTRRFVEGIRLLAETTGIFTETAGGVTTAVLRKLAERGDIDPSERVVLVITGEGLKTLDAIRGTFETHEIDPTTSSFDERLGESAVA